VLEIKDNARDHVGVADVAPGDISRNHGPVGISGEGHSSAFAVVKSGVLSEDEGSNSRAVDLDGEDRGGSLEVLGSISTDTQTNKSTVSGRVSDIGIASIARPGDGTAKSVTISKQSCGLELPSTAVTSNGEVAEVEGISSGDLIIGAEESLGLSSISTAVVFTSRRGTKDTLEVTTVIAETSDIGVQVEEHIRLSGIVEEVSGALANGDSGIVGMIGVGI